MKFKVGDKVKIIDDDDYVTGKIGDTGVVLNVDSIDSKRDIKLQLISGQTAYFKSSTLRILGRGQLIKPTKFVVFYDENDHDPMKEFSTDKELKEWLKEAVEDDDIDTDSIKIFEVKKEVFFKIKKSITISSKRKEMNHGR